MKFIKENKVMVICSAVVVLLLVFAFVPIPYCVPDLNADLAQGMQDEYNTKINGIQSDAKTPLPMPGITPDQTGVPSQSWVDARKNMIDTINKEQVQVDREAAEGNARGRVLNGVPLLPFQNGKIDTEIPGYLPKITNDAMTFKSLYAQEFRAWTGLLATGTATDKMDAEDAMPPRKDVIDAEFDAQEKIRQQSLPGGGTGGMGTNMTAESQHEKMEFEKNRVMKRASGDPPAIPGLHMYVEQAAFQKRAWLGMDSAPNEQQVFEAVVDSWLQADLVRAIHLTNVESLAGAGKQDVGHSAIKRLTRVVIGANARTRYLGSGTASAGGPNAQVANVTDPGPLFMTASSVAAGPAGGQAAPLVSVDNGNRGVAATKAAGVVLPKAENVTDFNLGMTGRSAGNTYDVVDMSVVMDIDPAWLNKFIDRFYRQNMGYTIINMQMRTVDPLDRASSGYLYGDGQVVEVELLVECILFRSWTDKLMPDDEKLLLGGTGAPAQ